MHINKRLSVDRIPFMRMIGILTDIANFLQDIRREVIIKRDLSDSTLRKMDSIVQDIELFKATVKKDNKIPS